MVNPITSQEWLVWRLYGDSEKSDTFHGDFIIKLARKFVWGFHGEIHGKSNYWSRMVSVETVWRQSSIYRV